MSCLRSLKYAAIDHAKSVWTTLGEPGDAMNHRSYADDGITIDAICKPKHLPQLIIKMESWPEYVIVFHISFSTLCR